MTEAAKQLKNWMDREPGIKMPRRAALLVLRRYQDYRKGYDCRTLSAIKLDPPTVSAAIDALLFEYPEFRAPRIVCQRCPLYHHEAEACQRAICAVDTVQSIADMIHADQDDAATEYVQTLERIIDEFMYARKNQGACVSTEALAMASEVANRVRQAKEAQSEKDRE